LPRWSTKAVWLPSPAIVVQHILATGKTLYVDDLVTDEAARSQGHGERMLDWLIEQAREAGCSMFSLDSGTHRQSAHAFYFRQRMRISSFHFVLPLK
jgi:GNAT superfamily N-acetyltransferase